MVRTAWRHVETNRNDLSTLAKKFKGVTTSSEIPCLVIELPVLIVKSVQNFEYEFYFVIQSQIRLITMKPVFDVLFQGQCV